MVEGLLSTGLPRLVFFAKYRPHARKFLPAVGGKVRKAQIYIFIGRLAKPNTMELGTSPLKGYGTNRNPLTPHTKL